MYFSATAMSPFGLARKSKPGPLSPPASSNPPMPGGMKCVPGLPTNEPPRALMAASRSNAARIALRTLMSSSGLIARFSGNQRKPPPGSVTSWSFWRWTTRLSTCAGGLVSSTRPSPDSTWRPETLASVAFVCSVTLSRYAGRVSLLASQFGLRTSSIDFPAL